MSTLNPHHGQNAAVLLSRLRLLVVAGCHETDRYRWRHRTNPAPPVF
jgi:hypothetical protein